jgi:hypothetical protein
MGYQRQQLPKVCGACGREFRGNSKQKYCSRECGRRRQKEQLAALAAYCRKCPHCGEQLGPMSGKRRVRGGAGAPTTRPTEGDGTG